MMQLSSTIADDLHLELFPANDGFLDQHLVGGRCLDAGQNQLIKFLKCVGDAAAQCRPG